MGMQGSTLTIRQLPLAGFKSEQWLIGVGWKLTIRRLPPAGFDRSERQKCERPNGLSFCACVRRSRISDSCDGFSADVMEKEFGPDEIFMLDRFAWQEPVQTFSLHSRAAGQQ